MSDVSTWQGSHPAFASQAPPAWRAEALARFEATGFPASKAEAWKYTSARKISKLPFAHTDTLVDGDALNAALTPLRVAGAAAELVFVNGRFDAERSQVTLDADGALQGVAGARLLSQMDAGTVLGQVATSDGLGFTDLNHAFVQDGLLLDLPANAVVDAPIHLIFVGQTASQDTVGNVRNVLRLGRSAEATVVETHLTLGETTALTNVVTEVVLDANAGLDHLVTGLAGTAGMYVGRTVAQVGRDARYRSHVSWLGGALVRNQIEATLTAPGAEAHLDGLYVLGARDHVDNHTVMRHASPDCISRETYKGVLGGHAKGIFDGIVIVDKDAQRTDSSQRNDNLLLSETADANAKPQLEIYADDVVCSHGTTVGQLDAGQLTYMRTRGIGLETAKNLLTAAFVAEVVESVRREDLRERLRGLVDERLGRLIAERMASLAAAGDAE